MWPPRPWTAVLHTWGSALTHHPHVHCIVPGGGLALEGQSWVSCRPRFFLPVRVLSRLFRRLFLEKLVAAHAEGQLSFFGELASLADRVAFAARLAPLRRAEWVVYAKRPFAGPEAVLAYLARYTHRVAISSSRLVAMNDKAVTFRWKDYRQDGQARRKLMTLAPGEFIRRFLLHVLPTGFNRIRHYGLFANPARAANLAKARALLQAPPPTPAPEAPVEPEPAAKPPAACPCCGGRMALVEIFTRGSGPGCPPPRPPFRHAFRIDSS